MPICMLQNWKRKYLEEGIGGLEKQNRGRAAVNGKKHGRPPRDDVGGIKNTRQCNVI